MNSNNIWENAHYYVDLMMEKRGFKLAQTMDTNLTLYKKNQYNIIIWFFNIDKLNIDYMKEFISILETNNYKHGIIIYQNYITSSTKKVLENLYKFDIELFIVKEFQYDLTQFKYYCHHEKLSSSEAKMIKDKFKSNMPYILKTDMICRYFYFQKNDIIKITRRNQSIVYRIVK
jgi:DNA-directed RNA polymerase subunit H (RpoH/RPB5)